MNIYGTVLPGSSYLASLARRTNLSREAQKRLKWFDHYAKFNNARLTCRYFGITPQTFYRWQRRFNPRDLTTLEGRSSRPLHVRQPETPVKIVTRIKELRKQYPAWGKDKLAVLLKKEGIYVSPSTIGRTINRLKKLGLIKEPATAIQIRLAKQRKWKPRYAVRKPKDYVIKEPGDLVEVDTLVIQLLPDLKRYQFSARDIVSKHDGLKAYSRATSFCAALFLDYLIKKYPFTIKAIQIDGGSEFKKDFEKECKKRGIKLFVLPPRSPKLNGCVERANGTHRREFYELNEIELSLIEHNKQLERWEYIYNHIRPHQALDYLTPNEYYQNYLKKKEAEVSLR